MPKKNTQHERDLPEKDRILRYRVEILELKTGSVRALPLVGMVRVSLARLKDETERPREEYLLLKDDSGPLEARNLDDLVIQSRAVPRRTVRANLAL
jgi:hypothetical protein